MFIISRFSACITSRELSPTSAAVETPAEAPAAEPAKAPAVKTAKAGLAPKGTGSRKLPMIEAAESAGTRSFQCARGGGTTEVLPVRSKTTTVDDAPAMRDVRVVVVDAPAAAPIVSPTIPSPAKPSEESNTETQSPIDSRTIPKKSRIRIPAGENSQRIPIDEPGIVLRYVHHVGRRRLNDDGLIVCCHRLLGGSFQITGFQSPLTHGLNRLIKSLLLIDVGVAKFGCPGKILVHIGEHRGELRQSFDTGIPGFFVYLFRQFLAFKVLVLIHPLLSLYDLVRISCGRQDLRDQCVRVKCDGRYESLQLFGTLLRSLRRRW